MTRIVLLALALALAAPAAQALTQLQRAAERDLREFGFREVDVRTLTTAQLAAITHIAHISEKDSAKRAQIRSVLGKPYNLRGLLFQN